jgi:hypothetical protein
MCKAPPSSALVENANEQRVTLYHIQRKRHRTLKILRRLPAFIRCSYFHNVCFPYFLEGEIIPVLN